MWKIITVSNFDLESYAQRVVAEHIPFEQEAKIMLDALVKTVRLDSYHYYSVVPQDKKLWLGMEEFGDNDCPLGCGEDLYGKCCCV